MINNNTTLAPVAIFVFNRPDHLRRTLEALSANAEFTSSPLYIYADNARNPKEQIKVDEVRQVIRDFQHPHKTVIEAPENRGLAKSIIAGVTQLCNQYGKVIVVEDDLIVSPFFLDYMNKALEKYADQPQVMQISGHMFPVDLQAETDAIFLPFTTSWGWATWQRAWQHMKIDPDAAKKKLASRRWRYQFDIDGSFPYARMLADRIAGKNNSWAIWWNFSVFNQQALTLFPTTSLVNNDGFDGSGTHCGDVNVVKMQFRNTAVVNFPPVAFVAAYARLLQKFFREDRGFKKNIYDALWRIFYRA